MGMLASFCLDRLGGAFLAPGSTTSLAALACTLTTAIPCVAPPARPVRMAIVLRALFPRSLWRSASGRADIGYFAFGLLFTGVALGWALLSADHVGAFVRRLLEQAFGPHRAVSVSTPACIAVTAGAFLVYELAYWLDHFLKHRIPFLWRFHATHHSAEHLSLLTNFRVHPVDTVIFYNIVAIGLGLFGGMVGWISGGAARPVAIGGTNALVMLSAIFVTHLQHSRLWVTFGPRWGWWLLGPAHHQIHHSIAVEHHDTNFGGSLAIWDRLFGTLTVPPAARPRIAFGVAGLDYAPHTLFGATLGPLVGIMRRPDAAHAMETAAKARP